MTDKPVRQRRKHTKNRSKETINMSGLTPRSAPDTGGKTVVIKGRVDPEDKQWCIEYAERSGKNESQIVREAIRAYKATIEAENNQ